MFYYLVACKVPPPYLHKSPVCEEDGFKKYESEYINSRIAESNLNIIKNAVEVLFKQFVMNHLLKYSWTDGSLYYVIWEIKEIDTDGIVNEYKHLFHRIDLLSDDDIKDMKIIEIVESYVSREKK